MSSEFQIAPCTCIGPWGGCLIKVVCKTSLMLLPLSSLTFNEVGSGSFVSNHLSSLATWLFFSANILFFMLIISYQFSAHE